jgi:hypothetical protein
MVRVSLASLLLIGCLPDTGDFRVGDEGDRDAAMADMAARDGGPPMDGALDGGVDFGPPEPDDCLPEPTCTDGCPIPWLLAAVEDLPGGRSCGGRILRLSVAETDAACICHGYDGGGAVPTLPFAVGFVPPKTIVTASEDGSILAIDADTDRVIWEESSADQPGDIFAIEGEDGTALVALATRRRGDFALREVRLYDAATGGEPIVRSISGDLPLGLGVPSVTQSTIDPQTFRAVDPNNYAAVDVNPWTDTRIEPAYTASREGYYVQDGYAAYVDGRHRTLWTGTRSDLPDSPSRVWDVSVVDAAGDQRLDPGNHCALYDDGFDYDVECDYLHAVPDPTVFNQKLVLCDYAGGRRITRMRAVDRCLDILEGGDLFDSARIARLALALPTYWAP